MCAACIHWVESIHCRVAVTRSRVRVAGETGEDIKPTLHYLYKNGIGGILDYAAEDDVQSEGGPASREPENEHIIARTFDYESEVGSRAPHAKGLHQNANRHLGPEGAQQFRTPLREQCPVHACRPRATATRRCS